MTRVHVNGEDSDPIPMKLGLGQGDVLSPLLFNIFTESMTRYVRSVPGYDGVTIREEGTTATVTVKETKYTDDSAFLTTSTAQLQLAARACVRWCNAWGLQVSLGEKKTEAMAFPAPSRRGQPPPAAPLRLTDADDGPVIAWTEDSEYRYLGLLLNPTLDLERRRSLTAKVDALKSAWNRYFWFSGVIRNSNPTMALQLFRTLVSGSGLYLMCLAMPSESYTAALDVLSKAAARTIFRLPRSTPVPLLWSMSRLPPAVAVLARERLRLIHKLASSPFPPDSDLARRVCMLTHRHDAAAIVNLPRTTPTTQAWPTTCLVLQLRLTRKYGVPHPPPTPRDEWFRVTSHAAKHCRRVGMAEVKSTHRNRDSDQAPPAAAPGPPPPVTVDRPQDPHSMHYAEFLCNPDAEEYDVKALNGRLSQHRNATALSIIGPNCSGSIIALANVTLPPERLSAVTRMWLGRPGLYQHPHAPPGRDIRATLERRGILPQARTEAQRQTRNAAFRQWRSDVSGMAQCLRCQAPMPDFEDPYHVLTRCQHAPVQAAQQAAARELPGLLALIITHCEAAMEQRHATASGPRGGDNAAAPPNNRLSVEQARALEEAKRLTRMLAGTTSITTVGQAIHLSETQRDTIIRNTTAGRFLLFHALLAATWPASKARRLPLPKGKGPTQAGERLARSVCIAMGDVFNVTVAKPNFLRNMASRWLLFASKHCRAIGGAWSRGMQPPPGPPPAAADTERGKARDRPNPRRQARGPIRAADSESEEEWDYDDDSDSDGSESDSEYSVYSDGSES